jgi:uncharacterized damage-inducible protein DinB
MLAKEEPTMERTPAFSFLTDTYATEIQKTIGLWRQFPEQSMDWRPHAKSRSVREQFEHQVQSEGRWMREMLGIDTGDPNPAERTKQSFITKYEADAKGRLAMLLEKSDEWWHGVAQFFDVPRTRAWILVRRMSHSSHHRGELVMYLRMLEGAVPSIYGPTADTDGKVVYEFPKAKEPAA